MTKEEENEPLSTEVGRDLGKLSKGAGKLVGEGLLNTYKGAKRKYKEGKKYLREKYHEGKRTMGSKGRGWYYEPYRHSLSSKGIKTSRGYGYAGEVPSIERDIYTLTAEGKYIDRAKDFAERTKLLAELSATDALQRGDLVGFQIGDISETVPDKENVSEITLQTLQEMDLWQDGYKDLVLINYPEYEDGEENDFVFQFQVQGGISQKGKRPRDPTKEHVYPYPKIKGWVHGTVDEKGDIEDFVFRIDGVSNLVIRDRIVRWLQSM